MTLTLTGADNCVVQVVQSVVLFVGLSFLSYDSKTFLANISFEFKLFHAIALASK